MFQFHRLNALNQMSADMKSGHALGPARGPEISRIHGASAKKRNEAKSPLIINSLNRDDPRRPHTQRSGQGFPGPWEFRAPPPLHLGTMYFRERDEFIPLTEIHGSQMKRGGCSEFPGPRESLTGALCVGAPGIIPVEGVNDQGAFRFISLFRRCSVDS